VAKVFHPLSRMIVFVEATCGPNAHPKGTKYRIAIGNEVWESGNPLVLKIQMVYEGSGVQGRRSPSFPLGSDDFSRVQEGANKLLEKAKNEGLVGIANNNQQANRDDQ
jgi:hypothetical protein